MWASRLFARSPAAVGLFIRFLFIGSRLCSTLLSDPASRRRPCASLSLLLHQDVKRTFTSKLSNMLGTHRHRGSGYPLAPPTPPYIRVRIRRFGRLSLSWTSEAGRARQSRHWAGRWRNVMASRQGRGAVAFSRRETAHSELSADRFRCFQITDRSRRRIHRSRSCSTEGVWQ